MPKKVIFLLIVCYILLIAYYFSLPFVGPYSHSHLQYAIAARSYIENGFDRFIPYVYPKATYLNHPPFLYVILSLFYRIFGDSEFVSRLVPFLFSLGSGWFFYNLLKRYLPEKTSRACLFFYLTFPMFLYFGAFIQFEPLVLFFCLGSLYFLEKYLSESKIVFLLLSVLCLMLSFVSDFSGYIFAILIAFYVLYKKQKRLSLGFFLLTIFSFFLHLAYLKSVGFPQNILLATYFNRANQNNIFRISFIVEFLTVLTLRFFIYFSPLLLLVVCKRKYWQDFWYNLRLNPIFFLFFLFPLANIFAIPGATLTHPYFLFYFLPIVSLLLGNFIVKTKKYLYLFLVIHILSSIIVFGIKIYQTARFTWQYKVAQEVAEKIKKEKVFYKNWALDKELFYYYGKKVSLEIYPDDLLALKKYRANHYLFVCFPQCHKSDHLFLSRLSKKFSFDKLDSPIPSYLFDLQKKSNREIKFDKEISYTNTVKPLGTIKKLLGIEQL